MTADVPLNDHHRERLALRKLGNPEHFQFYAWRCIGPEGARGVVLTGCVTTKVYSKGPRKGDPKYEGAPVEVVVTEDEIDAEQKRWSGETGLCGECYGKGQVVSGWSVTDGTRYRECSVCAGHGRAD